MTPGFTKSPEARFSPRAFLRSRRPELFSDSVVESSSNLDRSLLEYHLDSLTSRKEEGLFEVFARKLAAREVCPNLLPQTGPTGGGDGKVDTETFPVSEALTFAWITANGGEAARDRWAFAFSAKEDWRGKVASDIKKIAGTKRGYRKAFFISSRYIPARLRANVEDELREKCRLDVRIFDRNWLLDRVFTGHHEDLAITELKLEVPKLSSVAKGPQDLQAERELTELEQRITQAAQEQRQDFLFVTDCIEAAKLSRGLDRPRLETEGRFMRAKRAANAIKSPTVRLEAAYQEAWTTYWWFEDYQAFNTLYDEAEKYAAGSDNVHELELWHNLWTILHAAIARKEIDPAAGLLQSRTDRLRADLDRILKMEERPSAVMHAKALRLTMDLQLHLMAQETDQANAVLRKLKGVVRDCQMLVGFPWEPMVTIVTELADILGNLEAFSELFETVVEVSAKRDGELTAGRLLLKRGTAQLQAGKSYDAIRTLGRALLRLYKEESRADLVNALGLCAGAYESVGLLWAARGTMLHAASIAVSDFWTHSEITSLQGATFSRMKWLELQLGRLPQALAWHEVDAAVRSVLIQKGYDPGKVSYGQVEFSIIVGILLLKAELWQLKDLTRLPDALSRLQLSHAAIALWYALGHLDRVPAELREQKSEAELDQFFGKWRDQPASKELPRLPELNEAVKVKLTSRILGCQITVESESRAPCLELAESLIATLEALLATAHFKHFAGREPVLTIKIRHGDFVPFPFSFQLKEVEGFPQLEISCADFNPHSLSVAEQNAIKDLFGKVIIQLLARVFLVGDVEAALTQLIRDDHAMDRAMSFSSSFIALGNVLGYQPKQRIGAWCEATLSEYPLLRKEEWDAEDRHKRPSGDAAKMEPPIFGQGDPPGELAWQSVKHTEIENVSLIRLALWDRANWRGTVFLGDKAQRQPPVLALAYLNGEAGAEIFAHWSRELGKRDRDERLRITIIRGINRDQPFAYRVVVGTNLEAARMSAQTKRFLMISRLCVMEPKSHENLDRFVQHYGKFGGYFLCHAYLPALDKPPEVKLDPAIIKRQINIRDAWQIGRHDPDTIGIQPGDNPIVPPDQKQAPIFEVLETIRKMQGKK